jgi:hypothetical protein
MLVVFLCAQVIPVAAVGTQYQDPNNTSTATSPIFADNSGSAAGTAADQLSNYYFNQYKNSLGFDWLKTTSVNFSAFNGNAPQWNFNTFQPLTLKDNLDNFLFAQGQYGTINNTINVGLGYRSMNQDKSSMYGVNLFCDWQTTVQGENGYNPNGTHTRVGAGLEYFFGSMETRLNGYYGVSPDVQIGDNGLGTSVWQHVAPGADLSVGTDFSFWNAPWFKLTATGSYYGQTQNGTINGYSGSPLYANITAALQVIPQLSINGGGTFGNGGQSNANIGFQFNLLAPPQPALFVADPTINQLAATDISYKMLQPVQRNNTITVERYTQFASGTIIGTVTGLPDTDGTNLTATLGGVTVNPVWVYHTDIGGNYLTYTLANVPAVTQELVIARVNYTATPIAQNVTVPKGGIAIADVTFAPNAGILSGTVSGSDITNGSGITVLLDNNPVIANISWNGLEYTVIGVAAGEHNVVVAKDGYAATPPNQIFTMPAGGACDVDDVTLAGQPGRIDVLVTGITDGTYLTNTIDDVSNTNTSWEQTSSGVMYHINQVVVGTHTLRVNRSGYTANPLSQTVVVENGQVAQATVGFVLNGSILGTIDTSSTGVTIKIDGNTWTDITWSGADPNKTYMLNNVAPEVPHTLTITKSGYSAAPATREVTVASGTTSNVGITNFALYGTISGSITGLASSTGASIMLNGAVVPTANITWTGLNYVINNVTPGTYLGASGLVVARSGYTASPLQQTITVYPGTNTPAASVDFSQNGQIQGKITNLASATGVSVTLDGVAVAAGSVTWNGLNYVIDNVSPIPHQLVIAKSGYIASPEWQTVSVPAGGIGNATDVAFVQNGVDITVSGFQAPIPGDAKVVISKNGSVLENVPVTANGQVISRSLSNGTYTVTALATNCGVIVSESIANFTVGDYTGRVSGNVIFSDIYDVAVTMTDTAGNDLHRLEIANTATGAVVVRDSVAIGTSLIRDYWLTNGSYSAVLYNKDNTGSTAVTFTVAGANTAIAVGW